MVDNNKSRTEKVEDARAQIAHQIETNRHYEAISWQFLRLVFTIIGLILTIISISVSVIFSYEGVLEALRGLVNINPRALSSSVAQDVGFIDNFAAGVVVSLLILILLILFLISISDMFYEAPKFAFKIQVPPDMQNGIDLRQEPQENILKTYQTVIDANQEVLDKTKDYWEDCIWHLRRGIKLFFGTFGLGLVMFLSPSGSIPAFLLFSLISIFSYYAFTEVSRDDIAEYARINNSTDAGTYAIILISLTIPFLPDFLYDDDLIVFGLAISGLSIVLGSTVTDRDSLDKIIARNTMIMFLLFISILVIGLAEGFTSTIAPDYVVGVIFATGTFVAVEGYLFIVSWIRSMISKLLESYRATLVQKYEYFKAVVK